MKQKFISGLELGEKLNSEQFVLKSLAKKTTKNGDEYWDVKLGDKTGEISSKVWNNSIKSCANNLDDGAIVEINAKVEAGMGGKGKQIFINKMVAATDFDRRDFLASSERSSEDLWADLQVYIGKIKDEKIKELVDLIFSNKEFFAKYEIAPAAEKAHHDFIGGLMQHCLEMLASAESMFSFYPEINQDIVISGILLHDIGKVFELSVDASISRTDSGHFLGHIFQGAEMIGKYMEQISDFPEESRNQIIHIILSHHGKLEFGSPVLPLTIEAHLVSLADLMSTKLQLMKKFLDNDTDNNSNWSDYKHILGSRIYLGNKKDNNVGTQFIASELEEKSSQGKDESVRNQTANSSINNLELPF